MTWRLSIWIRRHRSAGAFSIYQRLMHWMVLILCIIQVPTAWAIQRTHMAHLFLKPKPFDLFLHQVHAWSGWLIMALALSQLILRFTYGRPPPIQGMSVLERMIAGVTHAVLYGQLLALPITGTIAMYVTFRIASLHSLLSWMLLVVATTHALAALWQHFRRRDDVLRRKIRNTK